MTSALSPVPRQRVTDANGTPLPGAKLLTYLTHTTTPLPVYADRDLTTPHANPVVADSGGLLPALFLLPQAYTFTLTDAQDVAVWTQDDVADPAQLTDQLILFGGAADPTPTTGIGVAGSSSLYARTTNPYHNYFANFGTASAPDWHYVAGAQGPLMRWGTIASADLTGTSAGQLGHVNGVILVPAPGGSDYQFLFPLALFLHYTWQTASYTAGGNLSLNYGSGGAAVTGVVSAANSLGAGVDKHVVLLNTVPTTNAIATGLSLNLVAASAFTNPGTAAGSLYFHVIYVKTG